MPPVHVVSHPLVVDRLTRMRDAATPSETFRRLMRECGALLAYEACRSLPTALVSVTTPLCTVQLSRLTGPAPVVLSVLRAGNGLLDGVLDVLPHAGVAHLGLYRDHETLRPVEYSFKYPLDIAERPVIVVDPMLATGHSAVAALARVAALGVKDLRFIALVAAPEGVAVLSAAYPHVELTVAGLDSHLNERGYIVPGLGDAGDRLYGT